MRHPWRNPENNTHQRERSLRPHPLLEAGAWVRILSYLRDNTAILQLLAKKRGFIVDLMHQKIAAAFPEADPNDIEVELALKLMDN